MTAAARGVVAAAGPAYELLIGAVAVADSRWREVLTHGQASHEAARRTRAGLPRRVAGFGRFGWINLLGLVPDTNGSRTALLDAVEALAPAELHRVLVGGRRVQLRRLVAEETVASAVAGDDRARRVLMGALRQEGTTLEIAPWLLRTPSADVRRVCLEVLRDLPEPPVAPSPRPVPAGPAASALGERAPGVRYTEVAGRLVLAACRGVDPVIVVVDEPDATIVVHPPRVDGERSDASARLRLIARAAGDLTRMRVLEEVRGGPRTLPELCSALDAPRTSLLHHLALLRGAGLVEVEVDEPGPNVYRLRAAGLEELARVARGFTLA